MDDYAEELKFKKQERDRIKAEINDLESRIIVEKGRYNHFEANNYRERVNRLKMRLNEVLMDISDLENKIREQNGQIQVMSAANLEAPKIQNGIIEITDDMVFGTGVDDIGGDVIQTVTRTVKRKIRYRNGKPVSQEETWDESITTRRLNTRNDVFIESTIKE